MKAEDYAEKARRWAHGLKLVDPTIKLVSCGHEVSPVSYGKIRCLMSRVMENGIRRFCKLWLDGLTFTRSTCILHWARRQSLASKA